MKSFILCALMCAVGSLSAQLNTTLRSNLDYPQFVNDVWGYAAPDGTEYALLGTQTGTAIISLANPDQPVEVDFIPGVRSNWRDIKTYRDWAYVVADDPGNGITAIDLSNLPGKVTFTDNLYDVPGSRNRFSQAHNIYIDTLSGLAFTAGGSFAVNNGGILIFDLAANPARPPLRAQAPAVYSHDVYFKDSILYSSEIFEGFLSIYDARNLDSITLLGQVETPANFTHNAWTTDDNQTIFTTDERPDAPVAAYDISDPADIKLLDEYRPIVSLNTGTIPHNVHVIGDFLSVSYYTDGLRVVDAADPSNLVEVANYDTWPGASGGFSGNWGAFPFLPSGLTLVSDRQTGLYVVDVDYQLASRLEGKITSAADGAAINGAEITLLTQQENLAVSDPQGNYQTGIAGAGTMEVVVSALGYLSDTTSVALMSGQTIQLDIALRKIQTFSPSIRVTTAAGNTGIEGASVDLISQDISYSDRTSMDGNVTLAEVISGNYQLIVSAWGYRPLIIEEVNAEQLNGKEYRLERGYVDDFISDLGWTVTTSATLGVWERGIPQRTQFNTALSQPGFDAPGDTGEQCYITGLAAGSSGSSNDVDGGATVLISPNIDPTFLSNPVLSYQYWFSAAGGDPLLPSNDSLTISITNGSDSVVLAQYTERSTAWRADSFRLDTLLDITPTMRLYVTTADFDPNGHVVEAGFDNFAIREASETVSTQPDLLADYRATIFPNPSDGPINLRYDFGRTDNLLLRVFSVTGQRFLERQLTPGAGTVEFGSDLPTGFYLVEVTSEGRRIFAGKVVRR